SFVLFASCENGFDELNTSKTGATALDPALVLNNAVISSSLPQGQLNYELGIVQQVISPNTGVLEGANFNKDNSNNTVSNWQNYYRNVLKYTDDVITRTKDVPARSNLMNMARIIQANAYIILTDTYGSVPYEEGGKGYTEQIFFPVYQTQQTIYQNVIQELQTATTALDAAGKIETADVLYSGNISKWKKFGFSLLLRAGMRLSKVDATLAQSTVAAAFAGGVITSNADNASIRHDANYVNGHGNTLNGTEAANFYLAKPFVDALKTNSDPRLSAIAIRFVGATSGPAQVAGVATKVASDQYGLQMGSTDADADALGKTLPGGGTRYAHSQVDRTRLAKRTSPMFLVTAGQTNLLLAEARFRGWITAGTASGYFSAGIAAHMDQMVSYDAGSAVAGADRDAYVAAMGTTFAGNELAQINYEYWVASFLNGQEAWANFRRSGFPVLAVNPFPGKVVNWITRLTYPPSEILVNSDNVQSAITAQGPDKLDTKVWWDK
ncbi:MAG: SusD/RagB family nutrient-binding outer membrane lipoprotein, partial [Bacteroidia bacterium]|nr:SusD/RagB family nutrient-binding outer membrane lipoprotein [Bacteroidia bacterium]